MKNFTIKEYRDEVTILGNLSMDMEANSYKAQQKKVEAVQMAMLMQDDTRHWMAMEIIDELSSLNDCALPKETPEVQHALWMLEISGYEDYAQEIRGWDWL